MNNFDPPVCSGANPLEPLDALVHQNYGLGVIEKNSKTREVAYTCSYASGHLISNSVMGIELNVH